jgi:hypothetical protein
MAELEDSRIRRAREGKRESRNLDFKERFDPGSKAEWCEIVKDIVAMANSGGGAIVVGVRNDGSASRGDLQPVLDLDPAKITDQIAKYTGHQVAGFEVVEVKRGRRRTATILVDELDEPLVFSRPGTYPDGEHSSGQGRAFSQGTLYVRHGAKSETANTADLAAIINRRLDQEREELMRNVRRVVEAPAGTEVIPIRRGVPNEAGEPTAIQLTADPGAPVYGKLDPDRTHPYRQKELIAEVNERLKRRAVNAYDIQAVRTVYEINETHRPTFAHQPKYASQQYSDAFVEWVVDQIQTVDDFLSRARDSYYEAKR